uniref:Peptidase S54 rhomboid domain-containing protein n=1 Tax=Branchiostoma floridae TaxID=7739 RepID=C3YJ16_BRAFL|eukprot:XP_002603667.1 hypothetical protein BRAFLDRAFT_128681 [Branchiostoma floridae]
MNQATDRREGNQRGSKSAAALRTWSQNSLHKARSVLSDIGGYLAITEEGARLGEWRERLQRSASQQFDLSVPLGCCELPTRDLAGTTTQTECDTLTGGHPGSVDPGTSSAVKSDVSSPVAEPEVSPTVAVVEPSEDVLSEAAPSLTKFSPVAVVEPSEDLLSEAAPSLAKPGLSSSSSEQVPSTSAAPVPAPRARSQRRRRKAASPIQPVTRRYMCQGCTGSWRATPCGSRLAGESATAAHIMRPCCYGIMGKCKLTTLQHCTFLNGVFSTSREEHCSKVNCLAQTCGPGDLSSDSAQPYQPRPSALTSQWWRWLLSPWLHAGLIHLLLVVTVQCIVGVRIERMVGGVRLAIIYLICGAGGNLMKNIYLTVSTKSFLLNPMQTGAVFSPYTPQMGGAAAACGLLGCACVELLQAWRLVPRALCKLLTLLTVLTVLFMAGTLPLVDNWAQLGGFVFGLLSALVFLPYIVLGRWDARRKRCLVVLGFVMLVLMYAVLLMMFYYVQGDFCPACKHFNCIPYTTDACHQPEDNYP